MLANILLLILNVAASFITLMLLARFYMQWQRISFRNQLGQFVVTTTDWAVRPLRRVIPGVFGLDLASLLPAWLVQVLLVAFELSLRGAAFSGNAAAVAAGLAGVGLIELLRMMVYLLIAVVLGSAVLSWVSPHAPLAPVLHGLAAPFLRPFRRVIPSIANVDLSPLVLLLVLQIVLMLLAGVRGSFAPLLFGG
ncbi:YggT family protein [Thauera chlorobenzoica]|uniref:Integral membrane stress protein YggT-like n=1 Tax=Thauera chlorobenzoica TaxID=96773 RepID=A0A1H5W4M3_9RHOO|nr:YggT family protein [Thauera chlorobenzoica]APR03367.1 integral membrane stress protein YggT-like [Thauera chlorobenzoica]SEF94186.1 YggT family protein [Thauera chlorobenzoica]